MLKCSGRGRRQLNQDHVAADSIRGSIGTRFSVLVACDGVGSVPNSAHCAKRLGARIMRHALRHLSESTGLSPDVVQELREVISRSTVDVRDYDGASTCAVLVHESSPTARDRVAAFWAGDSRACMIDSKGRLHVLTTDHVDSDGRLERYLTAGGVIGGEIDCALYAKVGTPIVMATVTDGVYRACSPTELRHFFLYIADRQVSASRKLFADLRRYLHSNISDNYSMAVMIRASRLPRRLLP